MSILAASRTCSTAFHLNDYVLGVLGHARSYAIFVGDFLSKVMEGAKRGTESTRPLTITKPASKHTDVGGVAIVPENLMWMADKWVRRANYLASWYADSV